MQRMFVTILLLNMLETDVINIKKGSAKSKFHKSYYLSYSGTSYLSSIICPFLSTLFYYDISTTSTGLQPLSTIVCRCSSYHVLTSVFVCSSSHAKSTCQKIHIDN